MKRISILAAALVVGAGIVGCKTQAELNAVFAKAQTMQTAPDYLIGEGDEVEVRVLGERELTMRDLVRPDGRISFPGYGDVLIAGKTVDAARGEMEEGFKTKMGLNNPTVYLSVKTFASKAVTVIGEVNVQGRFPYNGQMRVSDLLGLTRGVPITSDPNRAVLFREVAGNTKIYHVFLTDFLRKGDYSTNFYVQPGDILYVPKNFLSEAAAAITVAVSPLAAALSFLDFGSTTATFFVP